MKTQGNIHESIRLASEFLASTQMPSGGWGYNLRNQQAFMEPTCWALMALKTNTSIIRQLLGKSNLDYQLDEAVSRGLDLLLSAQLTDGSWTNALEMATPGDIRTALASWTLATCMPRSLKAAQAIARGLNWLTDQTRFEGGWSWCYGAHSFLEPTVLAILASHKTGILRFMRDDLMQFILKRQCDDGGWNSHLPTMLDVPQPSQPSMTPIAIIGLARLGLKATDDRMLKGLESLRANAVKGSVRTNYARSLYVWAWSELGKKADGDVVAEVIANLVARQNPDGDWDASILTTALASYALKRYSR